MELTVAQGRLHIEARKKKLLYMMIPLKISRLVSIEHWWLQGLILKANNKSEETGGDRPKVLR